MNLVEYAEHALKNGAKCWSCGGQVAKSDIRHYNHNNGWKVDGFEERQWLYFECPKQKCKYQTSFDKLGIPRDSVFAEVLLTSSKVAQKPDFFEAMMRFQYGTGDEVEKGFETMKRIAEEDSKDKKS